MTYSDHRRRGTAVQEPAANLPLQQRILTELAGGPLPWALLVFRVPGDYHVVYLATRALLQAKTVRVRADGAIGLRKDLEPVVDRAPQWR